MMKTLVLGLGKSGMAAYDLLLEEGDEVVGFDDHPLTVDRCKREGKRAVSSVDLGGFDRLILSPGISWDHPVVVQAQKAHLPIIGEMELALRRSSQPAIGITGSNGKTTVTLIIEHVLKEAGLSARAVGNVGAALSLYVKQAQKDDIFVVELSSYQLETVSAPSFDLGIILNITPNHLDRYSSMEDYAKVKCHLQNCLKEGAELWVHETVAMEFAHLLKNRYHVYGRNQSCILSTDRIALSRNSVVETFLPPSYRNLGWHASENALAAWIGCRQFGVYPKLFTEALKTFKMPAHRIEWVASIDGVDYINDSKGTSVDATIKAVESIEGGIILLVGGVDKGASYKVWKPFFAHKVRAVIAIGQAAYKIAEDLKPEYQVELVINFETAVLRCKTLAVPGDVVLLSPGCASLDMFKDYADRGETFKRIVNRLKEEKTQ